MNDRLKVGIIVAGFSLLLLALSGCRIELPPAAPAAGRGGVPTASGPTRPVPAATPTPSPTRPATATPSRPPAGGQDGVPVVDIPAGEFVMGLSLDQITTLRYQWRDDYYGRSPYAEISFHWSSPQLTVYLETFQIDQVEVTQGRYQACLEAGVCPTVPEAGPGGADYPIYVTYRAAETYCEWAGKRLPTEAEWEKAARGSDGRLFPWGDSWEPERVALEVSPAGSHPRDASPYGVLDMAGNLGEWTQSPLVAYPGHANPKFFNAALPVERGALAYEASLWAGGLAAARSWGADLNGFRCVSGGEPAPVAEVVVRYEPMVSPAPTATAVDLSRMEEIPAGEFLRGVDEASLPPELFQLYVDAMPQRPVYLDRYYIDRHPVTTAEFVEFLNATGHHRWSCGGWHCANVFEGPIDIPLGARIYLEDKQYFSATGDEKYPVSDATWNGAQAYCQWQGKRLPTEAEWEKAARGTDGRWYPWGNEPDPRMNEHERSNVWSSDPIGSKPYLASPYGVEDLLGLMLHGEWVADWYAADYYGQAGSTDNPQGPAEGEEKVLRGWGGISVPIRKYSQPVNQVYGSLPIAGFCCAYTPPPGR